MKQLQPNYEDLYSGPAITILLFVVNGTVVVCFLCSFWLNTMKPVLEKLCSKVAPQCTVLQCTFRVICFDHAGVQVNLRVGSEAGHDSCARRFSHCV